MNVKNDCIVNSLWKLDIYYLVFGELFVEYLVLYKV